MYVYAHYAALYCTLSVLYENLQFDRVKGHVRDHLWARSYS